MSTKTLNTQMLGGAQIAHGSHQGNSQKAAKREAVGAAGAPANGMSSIQKKEGDPHNKTMVLGDGPL